MVDWGAGAYERAVAELEPVAQAVVERADIDAGERVVDLACGTGNAALAAARRGATVTAVDHMPRLLEVARERADAEGLEVDVLEGDLHALPVADSCADAVISVFGLVSAGDPERILREVARIADHGARILISAWIPEGPLSGRLIEMERAARAAPGEPAPPATFPWSVPLAVSELAERCGLTLHGSYQTVLSLRDADGGLEHAPYVVHELGCA